MLWYRILFIIANFLTLVSSLSIESLYLDLIHRNLSDYTSLNNFYRSILQDVRHHRLIDTVQSPINVSRIKSGNYDEEYLKHSCYESASDLLSAHGYYNKTDIKLNREDIKALLPAILYSIENPGCARKSISTTPYSLFNLWIFGVIIIICIKAVHLLIFSISGDHCSSLTSSNISKATTTTDQNDIPQIPVVNIRPPSVKYRLWLGLGLNSFTCGLMLGTIIYHLIPHIYEVPNESFDYVYLLRATVVFFGIYLFFIVEKLLRFRFKIDEVPSNETDNDGEELRKLSDTSMMQMARMHGTIHATEDAEHPLNHSNPPARIPLHAESDDEIDLQINQVPINNNQQNLVHEHNHKHDLPHQTRNLILYHVINDFSNDLIYGCGLATALAHDYLIGSVLSLVIFSEGFRRYSQTISSMGRQRGLFLLLVSIFFLLFGYVIGGFLIEAGRQSKDSLWYIRTEYIYSIVYGALFYTALVTLIPELNDFGHHLQINLKQVNQTTKQRRLIKTLILICQNLFLIIGVIIALVLASMWRYYHRIHIYDYVCNRDSFRMKIYYLVIIIILIDSSLVLAINIDLNNFEGNNLYSHINTQNNLELFYQKLLQSNNIDDLKFIRNPINENDIQDLNIEHKCFKSINDLLNAFNIHPTTPNDSLTPVDVQRLLPVLVNVKLNDGCTKSEGHATWKNILIGFLTVTFINCSALGGAIILPFRNKPAFKWILSVFIGLAVGTLTGSGIFHLIPMAFDIPSLDTYHSYLNKALVTMITIYLFYIRDQLSRIFLNIETIVCTHSHGDDQSSIAASGLIDSISSTDRKLSSRNSKLIFENKHLNSLVQNLKAMKAAGWMIFLGDMLHNFIDGLTLGAAFMVSIGEGLRMSLPIICEEFPHELGDIAVLLSSGLSIGQALVVNFLAACSCYLGFFIGAKLGELEEFHGWIYALAGGMFVYIGLADMIPELVSMGDEVEKDFMNSQKPITIYLKLKILFYQNSGVILGIAIMFLLAKYGTHLENLVQL
ncbi:unnamed protein product [Adineta steineri]|uniref:Uncharacterized protein n=1 Tax=Adineta steineri TaxID=433720 RepID=A0A813ZAM4_9BILA|nr:unnamed protein product [Adineta steineri]CAF1239241.1 unnamed protein product [Adineta steineri]